MALSQKDLSFLNDEFMKNMDMKYDEKVSEDAMKEEMDENWEWWEKMSYVDKPQYLKDREKRDKDNRTGIIVQSLGEPLKGHLIIKMVTRKHKTESNILLSYNEIYDEDTNTGTVIKSKTNIDTGTQIIFNAKQHLKRLRYKDETYIILKEDDILGTL